MQASIDKELLDYFHGDDLAASTWKNKYAADGEKTPDDMHHRLEGTESGRYISVVQELQVYNSGRFSNVCAWN